MISERLSIVVKAIRLRYAVLVMLLTLLLAPEAYTAFGLAFALLLACLGAVIASRPRTADDAARRLAASTR